jgi:CheY-like chemotaxis protein
MPPLQRKFIAQPEGTKSVASIEPTTREIADKPGVLVVAGEHLVRLMIRLGLERNGFDVKLASNGREAIDLYRAHRAEIAVVLLDVQMPDLSGPQILRALRELNPALPACFMGGDSGTYEGENPIDRGATRFIPKAFLFADLGPQTAPRRDETVIAPRAG